MRFEKSRLLPLVCALTVLACRISFNGAGDDAPRLYLQAAPSPSLNDFFDLNWWYPPANASGFALQRRSPPGQFADVLQLDGSKVTLSVRLGFDDPYGPLEYRLVAKPSGSTSNVVSLTRGLSPPQHLDYQLAPDGFKVFFDKFVAIEPLPQTSQDIVLARRIVQSDSTHSAWVELDVERASSNIYVDTDLSGWVDGAHYEYEAFVRSGTLVSTPVSDKTSPAPFLSPIIVSAEAVGGTGAHLALQSPSKYARTLTISRQSTDDFVPIRLATIAAPAAGATIAYDDPIPTPGTYAYDVAVGENWLGIKAVRKWVVVLPLNSPLKASLVGLPHWAEVSRAPSGSFAVLANYFSMPGTLYHRVLLPPGDDGSHAYALQGVYAATPALLADAAGHPHSIYRVIDSIVHTWHDGAQWLSEPIGQQEPYFDPPVWGFSADGSLFAAWSTGSTLSVASQASGAWTVDSPVGVPGRFTQLHVTGDASGAPHLTFIAFHGVAQHLWRSASGWTLETVPLPPSIVQGSFIDQQTFLFASTDQVTFFGEIGNGTGSWWCVSDWTPSGWSTRDLVAAPSPPTINPPAPYHAALSRDGRRFAIAGDRGDLALFDGRSATVLSWPKNLVNQGTANFAVGFEPDGKAWVLDATVRWSDTALAGELESAVFLEER